MFGSTVPLPEPRVVPVRFTGSGSEYFRIWIVNILLTIVTLGLYYPFAKARRLRYFHGNTVVDGDALGFHGDAWKMFRGFVLMLLLLLAYGAAGRFSLVAGAVALVALGVMWPALWRASLQFRLGNTSWRGVRMRFEGSLPGAYGAMAPLALPVVLVALGNQMLAAADQPDAGAEALAAVPAWAPLLPLAGMFFGLLVLPWSLALIKRYQHGHYRYADQRSRLDVGIAAFYWLALRTLGLALLVGLAAAGLFFGGVAMGSSEAVRGADIGAAAAYGFVVTVLVLAAAYVAMWIVPGGYWSARLQNLVWGRTESAEARFASALGARRLMGLMLKNLLLTVVTLGLYRPFAAVAMARLKLEAVQVTLDGDPVHWAVGRGQQDGDAAGDFAGDFFGIDIGL